MLRRRRRDGADEADRDVQLQSGDAAVAEPGNGIVGGPWDVADDYPQAERIDCGSLLVPLRDEFDVQINEAEWVAVVHGESGMQLQAFAAPRTTGLWDEVRHEIAANIAESGGSCHEDQGAHGTELLAELPIGEEGQSNPPLQPVRFIGFDGPRWFLRGVVSGPAAANREVGGAFDEVFDDVVVVRGDYPAPPREQLEIRLPEEVQQAIASEVANEDEGWQLQNPFERGPEITETR